MNQWLIPTKFGCAGGRWWQLPTLCLEEACVPAAVESVAEELKIGSERPGEAVPGTPLSYLPRQCPKALHYRWGLGTRSLVYQSNIFPNCFPGELCDLNRLQFLHL